MKVFHLPSAKREVTTEELLFHDKKLQERWDHALQNIHYEAQKELDNIRIRYLTYNLLYLGIGVVLGVLFTL